jgi:D-threo-aldose 1-dehydrogenase
MLSTIMLPNGRPTTNLGFGCASLLRIAEQKERQQLLDLAVDLGITHFDVAHFYGLGAAEAELGRLFRRNSNKLTVGTKFGLGNISLTQTLQSHQSLGRKLLQQFPALKALVRRFYGTQMVKRDYSSNNCSASIDTSYRHLNLDHIDLFMVHEPEASAELDPSLSTLLASLKKKGRIGAYGLSGDPRLLNKILQQYPDLSGGILQWEDSILNQAVSQMDKRNNIIGLFGLVRCGLPTLQLAFKHVPQLRRFWSERLSCDLDKSEYLGAAILAQGLLSNPGGFVLYATTQARRLERTLLVLREPPWEIEQLQAFSNFWRDSDRNAH